MFPLIQLPRKSEDTQAYGAANAVDIGFPLIQLPRKSEAGTRNSAERTPQCVSINSTSEEVRSPIG